MRTVCTVTVYESTNFPKTKLKNPSWSAWLLCYAFVVSIQRRHNLHLQPVPITATDDCNVFTSGDEAPIPLPSVADSPVMLPLSQLNEVVRNDEYFHLSCRRTPGHAKFVGRVILMASSVLLVDITGTMSCTFTIRNV